MASNPKISVIVPVYRVEPYLDRCVQSICAQTYPDFELILVDDGSPDNCPALCDAWAAKDGRIRVIHQLNQGLSGARNSGIDAARGAYLSFIDSDDYIEPEMLRELVTALEATGAQMAVCNLVYEDENGIRFRYPDFSGIEDRVIGPEEYWNGYFSPCGVYYTVAWNKLYRRELFGNLRYPLGRRNEDELILGDLLSRCTAIACLGTVAYHYVQRGGSIMQDNQNYLDCWQVHLLRARERCLAGKTLQAEGILNNAVLNLWKRREHWQQDPAQCREFRHVVRQAAQVYGLLARRTGRKSMWFRAFLLRMGLERYIRFLHKRNPELFAPNPFDAGKLAAYQAAMAAAQAAPRRFVLIQTPTHGNLGDHAIALAERRFLQQHFPQVPLIEVPGFAFSSAPQAYRAGMDPGKDTVLIHGGGFIGSLWPEQEENVQLVLKELAGFRVVMLPQSVYYEEEESPRTRRSLRGYQACPRLLILARETYSQARMQRLMPAVRCELIPDMVLSLRYEGPALPRTGVGLCLRRDQEGILSGGQRDSLARMVQQQFPGQPVLWTDTVQPEEQTGAAAEASVWGKMKEFSGYRLVVTDRLHGMVFAALTGTPCIVLDNCDHKVQGVYDWVRQNPYLVYLDTVQNLPRALETLQPLLDRKHTFDPGTAPALFETLAQLLR